MTDIQRDMKKHDFSVIEKKWTKKWQEEKVYEPDFSAPRGKGKFYNLMMFPYPSAEGLHVGNMYAFTGTDIYGRFKRMRGYDVFEPIGLDGFGIHSENYALKVGTHPAKQAEISEERFYKQLEIVGNGFAWEERLETYKPEYYKWTQWIFTEMWRNGLAYRKKQAVNWCPSCKTVLSDEQAEKGRCERCGSEVEKKDLEQWFFRITKYAEKLLENIETIDWSEHVKIAQRNWIGKSEGALIKFQVKSEKLNVGEIEVFTTRPDTLFGATYMVVAPEHEIISKIKDKISNLDDVEGYIADAKKKSEEERIENKEKTGIELKGIKAVNPANNEEIPIFVADYVLSGYGTGAIMAVPAHDERDFEFAKKYNLPIRMVICPNYPEKTCPILENAYTGEGHLVDSGKFDGVSSEDAKKKITEFVGGEMYTQFRLRDWLVSRQRYWGPPIPMIYCESCAKEGRGEQKEMPGWYAVPDDSLPVILPQVEDFRPKGTGESPLATDESFCKTMCPACGGDARRETDVSDTFLDSAWYYIGFLLKTSNLEFKISNLKFGDIVKRWLPVDMYIGGAEHSVLHLLYVRFLAMALKDAGIISFEEPFPKFRAHGLLIKDGAKMSKSKGNVINPDEYVEEFGADAFRMYLMFLAPFEQGGDFRDQGILGPSRFLDRIKKFYEEKEWSSNSDEKIEKSIHRTIKKVTEDIENLQYNTAISALMILLNECEKTERITRINAEIFLKLLAPFAPFLVEEIWSRFFDTEKSRILDSQGESGQVSKGFQSVHRELWPEYDEKKLVEDSFAIVVQINGKVRDQFEISRTATQKEIETKALSCEHVVKTMGEKKPKKIIYVPGRLVNIVL